MESVLCGGEHDITSSTRYLKLTCNSDILSLFELVLIDDDGNIVTPVNADDYPNLFDESDKYDEKDFRNGTYFDEVYHARTAYEYICLLYTSNQRQEELLFLSYRYFWCGLRL